MSDQLWRVTAPHFVAGIVVRGCSIVGTAPILRWALTKNFAWFQRYCSQKNWQLEPYSEGDYYSLLGNA